MKTDRFHLISGAIALAVICLGQGQPSPQPEFSVHFSEWHLSPLIKVNPERMEGAYDITSLMRTQESSLLALLSMAEQTAKFDQNQVRLKVRQGSQEWLVDANGVVKRNGLETQLSEADFWKLKLKIYLALPKENKLPASKTRRRHPMTRTQHFYADEAENQ